MTDTANVLDDFLWNNNMPVVETESRKEEQIPSTPVTSNVKRSTPFKVPTSSSRRRV